MKKTRCEELEKLCIKAVENKKTHFKFEGDMISIKYAKSILKNIK